MEHFKQAVPAPAPGSAAASRPLPSAAPQPARTASHAAVHPDDLGARVPASAHLIVPTGGEPAQAGASTPNAAHLPAARPASRVSLRPPQQVLSAQAGLPGISAAQPSPSAAAGMKTATSQKVQALHSVPSQVQKEPLRKAHPQMFESVRAKFREALAAVLGMDSDQRTVQQSASGISPIGSAGENKSADDGTLKGSSSSKSQKAGKAHTDTGSKFVDADADIDPEATVSLNEPESKRAKISDEITDEMKGSIQSGQMLAFKIEEELFKLFGGVNKKYKEKGRSLLFNLKDKSNPVLRERVLSGDITPKFLCSMTTEELASKELSAWRLAKAEELAKMVVLPNREVDVRRLVRKTHKGEFHVEVKEPDGMAVEVELRGNSLSHVPKSIDGQTKADNRASLHKGDKDSDNTLQDGISVKGNSNTQSNLECLVNEKADPMQECMLDELKDTENLSGTMSLDKSMVTLYSEPHYEDHSAETAEDACTNKPDIMLRPEKYHITEDNATLSEHEFKCDAPSPQGKCRSEIKSPKNVSFSSFCQVKPDGDMLINAFTERMAAEKLDTGSGSVSIPGGTMQSNTTPDAALTHGNLWEGTIQFTLSSLTNVVAVFKSGEKPSTNGWRRFVEIKGRVRLPAFQEFLEQLPNSRRRAIMVTELRWKEDSLECGRQHLLQTIDSYIADERVGLVKLTEGVELYLCPSHGKAAQILAEYLPKEHLGSLTVTGEASVIGVVVWRRPNVSARIPTTNDGSKRQSMSISRRQQVVIASSVPMPSQRTKPPASHFIHSNERHRLDDDPSDDVPPGFGEGVVKHDDDLPEHDLVSASNTSASVATSHASRSQQHLPGISRPLDPVRQLVRKYGNSYVSAQPWDGNDDDFRPLDEVRQLVRRYGNRYVDDDLPEQDWDLIRSGHQQIRHPEPLLPLSEHDQQTHHYYHQQQQQQEHYDGMLLHYHRHHHQQQEHYDAMLLQQRAMATPQMTSPASQVYVRPQQHVMTAQQRRNYQSVMQRVEARPGQLGWQSSTQWHVAGMPAEAVSPMQDVVRRSYFAVEPGTVAPRQASLLGVREPWHWEQQQYVLERF